MQGVWIKQSWFSPPLFSPQAVITWSCFYSFSELLKIPLRGISSSVRWNVRLDIGDGTIVYKLLIKFVNDVH